MVGFHPFYETVYLGVLTPVHFHQSPLTASMFTTASSTPSPKSGATMVVRSWEVVPMGHGHCAVTLLMTLAPLFKSGTCTVDGWALWSACSTCTSHPAHPGQFQRVTLMRRDSTFRQRVSPLCENFKSMLDSLMLRQMSNSNSMSRLDSTYRGAREPYNSLIWENDERWVHSYAFRIQLACKYVL
jgi:hypothetical protein